MDLFELLGTITIKDAEARRALRDVGNEGEKTESRLSKAFKAVGKGALAVGKTIATGLAAGATAMGALTVKALNLSGELEQNMGGSEAVFKEYAESMQETAKEAFSNMGLSTSDFLATANKMGALFQGAGFSIKDSSTIATDAMQRAADVASIMGIDTASAMEAIAGAAKGNFTMMDNLGVAMNDTTLQAYALSKGITKSTQEMTNQEKIGLAMEMFMEKTAYAAGNYAKENETLAGSLNTAKAALTNFLDGSGDVDSLVSSVTNAAKVIAKNLTEILPRLTTGLAEVVKGLLPQVAPLLQQLLPAIIDGAVSLIEGLVSVLPSVLDTLLNDALPALIEGVKNIFTGLLMALPTIIQTIMDALPMLAEQLISGLVDVIILVAENLPTIIQPIVSGLPNLLTTIVTALMNALPLLINAAQSLVMGLLGMLPTMIPQFIQAIIQMVTMIVQQLPILIPQLVGAIVSLITMIAQQLPVIIPQLVEALITVVNLLIEQLPVIIPMLLESVGTIVMAIIEALPEILKALTDALPAILQAVWDAIVMVFKNLPQWFGQIFSGAVDIIKGVWSVLTGFFKNIWSNIKNVFAPVGNFFKNAFTSAWNAIKNVFSNVGTFFTGIWDKIKNAFSAIGTKIGDAISGAVKSGINGLLGSAENIINGFLKMINGAIDLINKIPGVNISKVQLVKFTRLAEGGVVDEPTPAVFGEDGAEAVVPLENNTGWMKKVAQQLHEFSIESKNDLAGMVSMRSIELQQQQISESQRLNIKVDRILDLLAQFFPDALDAMRTPMVLDPNGAAVAMAPAMDIELGKIAIKKGRGR